jgi:hypothetical protein
MRNKVAQARGPLSIDDFVLYLRSLGKSLSELSGAQASAASIGEGQVDDKIKCPRRDAALWCPPDQGALKVNVDDTFNGETGEVVVGAIVHDHFDQPHAMTWRLVGHCKEAEEAEAMALLEGLRLVQRWPVSMPVVLESTVQI